MKYIAILFLSILISCTSSKKAAQISNEQPVQKSTFQEFSVLNNRAVVALLDSNYELAVDYYRQAFAKMEVDYVEPYFNAYYVAKKVGDCEMSFFAAKQLLQFGSWMEHFQKNPCLYDDDYIWSELEIHFVADENQIPFHLEKSMRRWSNMDSVVQTQSGLYDSIETAFLDLYQRYGFPSERLLGAEWSLGGMIHQHYRAYAPLVRDNPKIKAIFDKALEKGQISSSEYAGLFPNSVYFLELVFVVDSENYDSYIFTFTDDELKAIDERRIGIGLPALQQVRKTLVNAEMYIGRYIPYELGWSKSLALYKEMPTYQTSKKHEFGKVVEINGGAGKTRYLGRRRH